MDQAAQDRETTRTRSAATRAKAQPAVDPKVIRRAARLLIESHGPAAAERAHDRYRLLLAEGYPPAAELWLEVATVIAALARPRRLRKA